LALGLLGAVATVTCFLPALATLGSSAIAPLPLLLGNEPSRILSSALSFRALSVTLPSAVLTTILLPILLSRTAVTTQLGKALSVRGVLGDAREVLPSLLVTWIVLVLHRLGQAAIGRITSQFTLIFCLPGIAASVILATGLQAHQYLVLAHLTGQIRYRLEHHREGAPGAA